MPKDLNSTGRWLMKRLAQGLAPELQDRKDLLAVLREAGERGLVDGDALTMLEGVLEVGDLQVRDIMVPRAQKEVADLEHPLERSQEHTSELQSRSDLVRRLLLDKKNNVAATACEV